ncbi:hypothetical protein ACR3I8_07620 [Priestia flexa]
MINEQKEQEKKAQQKPEAKVEEDETPIEAIEAYSSFDKSINQGLSELQQKLSGVQRHKMRQQAVNRERDMNSQDLFLKLQRKMDK